MKHAIVISIILSFLGFWVNAQEVDSVKIDTDRPTRSYSPKTVPKGRFLLETGFEVNQDNHTSRVNRDDLQTTSTTYNISVLRYGITKGIELRFSQALVNFQDEDTGTIIETGAELTPTLIGAKAKLIESKRGNTTVSFLAQVGGSFLSDVETGAILETMLVVRHSLTDRLDFGYNLGGLYVENVIDYQTFVSGYLSYAVSNKVSVFTESYYNSGGGGPDISQILGGFQFKLNPKIQIDVFGGTKIDPLASDVLFGFGAGFLF